jgi:hypothetical protein
MKKYECKICNKYSSNIISDIIKHLSNKKLCKRSIQSFEYSNDQLLILSLLNNDDINDNLINIINLYQSNIIFDNKIDFLNNIKNINNNKLKKCTFCENQFNKISDLRNHVILDCYYKNIVNNNKINNHNTNNINNLNTNKIINNDITNIKNINNNINITNNNITNNITNNNNINIYIDSKKIIPFDENWNLNNIDNLDSLIFSKRMYTELLQNVLKNDINLNVIIDNNKNSGFIYKNDNEKYISMECESIIDKTMEKLKYHLLEINNNVIEKYFDECIKFSKININKKYNDYFDNKELKEKVSCCIKEIYENKRDEAINVYKNISNNDIEY